MAGSDGPTVSLSFANNFWGKDDAGVNPLLERMTNAKTTSDELKDFYHARAQIEEEYAKKILNLARKPLGSGEAGTLRMSLDVVRAELESTGKAHQAIAGQMKQELEEPLVAFAGGLKERRKIIQTGIEKLLATKNKQTSSVNKARDRYEQDCLKIKGYLAQGHMVMGQEERKNKAKLEKTQIQMSATSQEYEQAVKVLEETTGRWNREWKAACDKFQDLEEERLDFTKSSLWSFANIASTVCVSDDASCEKIRLSLEDCDVEKDITGFIKDQGTGQEIPDPPKYINFCRGDIPDNASVASDDGAYSVAQFARAMNPAFRTSSPQPSNYSSHHNPESVLRQSIGASSQRSMGSERQRSTSPGPVPDMQPSGKSQYAPDDARRPSLQYQPNEPRRMSVSQAQQNGYGDQTRSAQAHQNGYGDQPRGAAQPQHNGYGDQPRSKSVAQPQQNQYGDIPKVPHDPYPLDGMTQFCRLGPPSEQSSMPSPRMDSGDESHSEYSNPTSFSSFDPASGHTSPTKQYNGSDLSSASERPVLEKKKSGFFQNRSPFGRRKSRRDNEAPQITATNITPTQRNTWTAPSPSRPVTSGSPTRPFGREARNVGFGGGATPDVEPERADPRANFQLNVGNNVFDVASPDSRSDGRRHASPQKESFAADDSDPIAQALAELKGVTKQASMRVSADRYAGIATPAPSSVSGRASPMPGPGMNSDLRAAQRGTPPPQYEQPPVSRLGAPRPAHTSKTMQQTTANYIGQRREVFNGGQAGAPVPRPMSAMGRVGQPMPRSTSPAPMRSTSPRPYMTNGAPPQGQQQYRAPSPNPYGGVNRPRANTTSPMKQHQGYGGNGGYDPNSSTGPGHSRGQSMGQPMGRPPSSRGSNDGGAVVLAPADNGGSQYGGSQRRMRPTSQYYGADGGWAAAASPSSPGGGQVSVPRPRPQSQAGGRPMTKDGRPILHFSRAVYMYAAAIPEELSFAKGDVLAVLRLQDDGWWEAEHPKLGKRGLVPSNYLVPA